MAEKKLGRGLDFLLSESIKETLDELRSIEMDKIRPSRTQPRVDFDQKAIQEMADSIAEKGLLQPIIVRQSGEEYEIVAGERRWKACKMLGHKRIPAIVRDVNDSQMLELALIENIQRKDLNPIEKAEGFKKLIEEYSYTQEELARRIGIDRSSITNFLRILKLPEEVRNAVSRETITMGHARALLAFNSEEIQKEICRKIESDRLSVREVESLVLKQPRKKREGGKKTAYIKEIEEKLRMHFGTKVIVRENRKGGRIIIEFFSKEDFERIYEKLLA